MTTYTIFCRVIGTISDKYGASVSEPEILVDEVNAKQLQEFCNYASEIVDPSTKVVNVSGWDPAKKEIVRGSIEFSSHPSLFFESSNLPKHCISIGPEHLIIPADVIANSIHHHFKSRNPDQIGEPLLTKTAIRHHPLSMHFWGLTDRPECGDSDSMFGYPKGQFDLPHAIKYKSVPQFWAGDRTVSKKFASSLVRSRFAYQPLLTLWRAIELTFNHPGIKGTPKTDRYKDFAFHLVKKMGKNMSIENIWAKEIRQYQVERQNDSASNSTINKEVYFLSKVYGVLMELKLVHENPCKLVKSLSERSGQIEAYIGHDDYIRMVNEADHFFEPILATLYMTGMRRNEALNLRRSDVHMDKRLILLGSQATKEAKRKRVPIHRDLLPYVQQALSVQSLRDDHVFLRDGKFVTPDQVRKAWTKITAGMVPRPRLHDLRHTFKTNCRRSGIDVEIRESILGHALKVKDVSSRYGRISNEEFVRAIDQLTFEHGETEIVREDAAYKTKCAQNVYKTQVG